MQRTRSSLARSTMLWVPFLAIGIDPGQDYTWTITYDYYTLDAAR